MATRCSCRVMVRCNAAITHITNHQQLTEGSELFRVSRNLNPIAASLTPHPFQCSDECGFLGLDAFDQFGGQPVGWCNEYVLSIRFDTDTALGEF